MEESKTEGLAKWLQGVAELHWGIASDEQDKLEARRLHECAAELLRFHRMKIRFRDQLNPLRSSK